MDNLAEYKQWAELKCKELSQALKLGATNLEPRSQAGLHKLWYPVVRDMSTWSKFGAHGEHGDVFLFSNLGAL